MKLNDKKIEISEPRTIHDSEGFVTMTLEHIDVPLWVYFRQLSGIEV